MTEPGIGIMIQSCYIIFNIKNTFDSLSPIIILQYLIVKKSGEELKAT